MAAVVGCIPTVVDSLLAGILKAFSISFEELEPHITEDITPRLLGLIDTGTVDCAFMARTPATAGYEFTPLLEEEFLLAVPESHPLAGHDAVESEDLKGLPLVLLGEGHCFRDQVLDLCRGSRAQEHQVATLGALAVLVAAGEGCTLLPERWCRNGVPGCAVMKVRSHQAQRELGMVWRRGDHRAEQFTALAEAVATVLGGL